MSVPADSRAALAGAWAREQLRAEVLEFSVASADASFRRYFRARAGGVSRIVMDAPPEHEDCRAFVRIARLLRGWGLNAPEILAEDHARGFLLLGDLGTQTYLDVLDEGNADRLFARAQAALLTLQQRAQADPASWTFLPAYDSALLWREARLFTEWYLPRHLQVAIPATRLAAFEEAVELLVQSALAQPRTFVHRDFMPRNLMVSDPDPGILDFQDAVAGPATYDAVCLYRDAFLSWPPQRVAGWLRGYWDAARAARLPVPDAFGEFERAADWMGLQRHLKVLGIFARLTHRDGKPKYAADTPRFVRYVMDVAPRYPELRAITDLFEHHVLPRVSP